MGLFIQYIEIFFFHSVASQFNRQYLIYLNSLEKTASKCIFILKVAEMIPGRN